MRHFTLSLSEREFCEAVDGRKVLEIRENESKANELLGRVKRRNRPAVGYYTTLYCPRIRSGIMRRVSEVHTVVIYLGDDHPLWIDGEPKRHSEQEEFARKAGYKRWHEFAIDVLIKYGRKFNGYSVEWSRRTS